MALLDVRSRMPHDGGSRWSRPVRGTGQPRPIPTSETKAPWPLRMVCLMRRLSIVCGVLLLAPLAAWGEDSPLLSGTEVPPLLSGTWVGTHDGQATVWQIVDEQRLRVDGRPGDFAVRGDTLIVSFDPPVPADPDPGVREVAVYHFLASRPTNGQARLFVSGFDLGKQGAMLMLEPEAQSEDGPTEDAAPPAPPQSCRPTSQQTASIPSGGGRIHR